MNTRSRALVAFLGLGLIAGLAGCTGQDEPTPNGSKLPVASTAAKAVFSERTQSFGLPLNMDTYDYLGQLPDHRLVFLAASGSQGAMPALALDASGVATQLDFNDQVLSELRTTQDDYQNSPVAFTEDSLSYISSRIDGDDETTESIKVPFATGQREVVEFGQDGTERMTRAAEKVRKDARAYSAGTLQSLQIITDLNSKAPYESYVTTTTGQPQVNFVTGGKVAWSASPVDGVQYVKADENVAVISGGNGFSIYDVHTGALLNRVDAGERSFCRVVTQPSAQTALMHCGEGDGVPTRYRLVSLTAA